MIGVGVSMKTFREIRNLREAVKTVGPKWQKDGKLFPITPNQWKKEWKSKYNVEFIRVEKKKTLPNRPQQTFVFVKGEEKDLADWFMKVYAKQPGMNVPLLKSASKTLDMVKDADDGRNFGFSIESVQEAGHKIDRGRQAIGLLDKQRAAKVRAIAKKYKLKTDEHPSTKYRPPKDAAKLKGLVDITLIGPPGIVDKAMREVPMHPDVAKLLKQHNENKFRSLRANLKDLSEAAGFEFVDMDKKRRDTVIALAKKFKLKVKERKKGSLSNIDVEGSNANVAKFMQNLPQDALESVQKEFTSISMRDIMRKHGRELKKVARTGNLELSRSAEEDLFNWTLDNGEVMTDDPDEFIEWLDNNIDDIVKGRIR